MTSLTMRALLLLLTAGVRLVLGANLLSASATLDCYSFTWPGVNVSISCDDKQIDANGESQPCDYPLVYTVPYYSPPNISELNLFCSENNCPAYTCKEKGKQCIRWNWYDVNGTCPTIQRLTNYSVFCGSLADQTNPSNPVSITNGCWKMRVGTFMKEVCVCNSKYCNTSPEMSPGLNLLLALSLVALLLPPALHN